MPQTNGAMPKRRGRPPGREFPRETKVQLSQNQREACETMAAYLNVSVSALIRSLVDERLMGKGR